MLNNKTWSCSLAGLAGGWQHRHHHRIQSYLLLRFGTTGPDPGTVSCLSVEHITVPEKVRLGSLGILGTTCAWYDNPTAWCPECEFFREHRVGPRRQQGLWYYTWHQMVIIPVTEVGEILSHMIRFDFIYSFGTYFVEIISYGEL